MTKTLILELPLTDAERRRVNHAVYAAVRANDCIIPDATAWASRDGLWVQLAACPNVDIFCDPFFNGEDDDAKRGLWRITAMDQRREDPQHGGALMVAESTVPYAWTQDDAVNVQAWRAAVIAFIAMQRPAIVAADAIEV